MQQRTIGDLQVSAIGLGGMPMSVEGRPDEDHSIATIHAALDAGVTLIDTADAYHLAADVVGQDETGHNEVLIAKALKSWGHGTSDILVATKGGHLRTPDGTWILDGRPEHIKRAAKESAARLGVDTIGLYQHHRPDPDVPYEETIGAFAELLDEGVIRMAGISNANPDQIRLANEVLGGHLASVQNQFSPAFRSSLPELKLCAEIDIAFCRGVPSVASVAPASWPSATRHSPTSPSTTVSAPSRSAWPGSSPCHRRSSPSPAHPGRRASATRSKP